MSKWKAKLAEWEKVRDECTELGADAAVEWIERERIAWLGEAGPKSELTAERRAKATEEYHRAKTELAAAQGSIMIGTVDPAQAIANAERLTIAEQAFNRRQRERQGAADIAAGFERSIDRCGLVALDAWQDAEKAATGILAAALDGRMWEPTPTMLATGQVPNAATRMWDALAEKRALEAYPALIKRHDENALELDKVRASFALRREWIAARRATKKRDAQRVLAELAAE